MREISYRAKRKDNGEWVYGVPLKEGYSQEVEMLWYEYSSLAYTERVQVIPETVGQYTGLTDKNGKKIFEGDIVLFEDECPNNYEYHDCTEMRCGEMRFDDGEFYLTNRIAVEMGDLIYDGKLDGEIIGNIHDNPELLEVK